MYKIFRKEILKNIISFILLLLVSIFLVIISQFKETYFLSGYKAIIAFSFILIIYIFCIFYMFHFFMHINEKNNSTIHFNCNHIFCIRKRLNTFDEEDRVRIKKHFKTIFDNASNIMDGFDHFCKFCLFYKFFYFAGILIQITFIVIKQINLQAIYCSLFYILSVFLLLLQIIYHYFSIKTICTYIVNWTEEINLASTPIKKRRTNNG